MQDGVVITMICQTQTFVIIMNSNSKMILNGCVRITKALQGLASTTRSECSWDCAMDSEHSSVAMVQASVVNGSISKHVIC